MEKQKIQANKVYYNLLAFVYHDYFSILIIIIIIMIKQNFIHRFKKNRLFTDSRI